MTDVICDDQVLMALQYSTQWDSFAHVGSRFDADGDGVAEMVFYNGFRAGEDIRPAAEDPGASEPFARYPGPDARALGIERLAEHGVQGRGVMIDLEDAVPLAEKDAARTLARSFLLAFPDRSKEIFVRINGLDTKYALDDLKAVLPARPDGIRLPKADEPEVVERLNRFQRTDEKAFEAVAALSEFNQQAYQLFAQPAIQAKNHQRAFGRLDFIGSQNQAL